MHETSPNPKIESKRVLVDSEAENREIVGMFNLSPESLEYKGRYQISNFDFEYKQEHYEKDVILLFDKMNNGEYAIDRALDKIREKLGSVANTIDWSKPINIQDIVNLYRQNSDDENNKFFTIFERAGVFSIERLGYEELYDMLMEKTQPHLHSELHTKIIRAIKQKLARWRDRNESIEA